MLLLRNFSPNTVRVFVFLVYTPVPECYVYREKGEDKGRREEFVE